MGTVVMKNWLPLVLGPGEQHVKWEVRTPVALGRGKRGEIGTSIGHGQQERHVVLVLEVLVSKLLAVDALAWQGGTSRTTGSSDGRSRATRTSSSVVVGEVTALQHEVGDHAMEAAARQKDSRVTGGNNTAESGTHQPL